MSALSRRTMLALSGAAATLWASPLRATTLTTDVAEADTRSHALLVFDKPKYPVGFTHFDYVNPDAPKGGEIRLTASTWAFNQNPITYNTFNTFILRGDAPPLMEMCHGTLMTRALDEPDAVYPLIAEWVEVEGKRYAFTINPNARFSDGSPLTAEDVAFSAELLLEKSHPILRNILAGIKSVEAADKDTAVITFKDGTSNRLPPLVTALMPILSKAYYTANDFTQATLDIPVGSGPYTVGDHAPGRYVSYRRLPDYWAADLPTQRGHNNFDRLRMEFYREHTISFEAFKKGDVTFREEFTSKTWATEYDFPAVQDGRIKKHVFPDERPAGAQGWFMNTRREKFADPRVREALNYAFDFEWTNANVFYGAYTRTPSFFVNSDMMATGEPSPEELALLEPFRDQVPAAVFGPAWTPPVTDGTGRDRAPLREANRLFAEAGWSRQGGKLVNANGQPFTIEFLYRQPRSERVLQPFASRLRLLGIEPQLRMVDAAQFESRLKSFDYDVVTRRFSLSLTPGEVIREFWTSARADIEGSRNLSGIKDPVVDALTDTLIQAKTREEMVTAARALDRVLRSGFYWVPQWYKGSHTTAFWDIFGRPEIKPPYDLPVTTTWWAKEA